MSEPMNNFERIIEYEPYFAMHVNHEGHLYVIHLQSAEGQGAEVIGAVNNIVKAAHALHVAIGVTEGGG